MRWLKGLLFGRAGLVTFCDGCGTVCDAACRAARRRDDTLLAAAGYRGGLL
jgi:hypothetical protein